MQVIIAEKPSLARNIVAGIESFCDFRMAKRGGYYEGGDYLVTWAFGHLFRSPILRNITRIPMGTTAGR